jgi:hypothetical protein
MAGDTFFRFAVTWLMLFTSKSFIEVASSLILMLVALILTPLYLLIIDPLEWVLNSLAGERINSLEEKIKKQAKTEL